MLGNQVIAENYLKKVEFKQRRMFNHSETNPVANYQLQNSQSLENTHENSMGDLTLEGTIDEDT